MERAAFSSAQRAESQEKISSIVRREMAAERPIESDDHHYNQRSLAATVAVTAMCMPKFSKPNRYV